MTAPGGGGDAGTSSVGRRRRRPEPSPIERALGLLTRREHSRQELARKLLVSRYNMSMLLPHLEKRGLIERRSDGRDKRVLRLFLTDEGKEITEQAMKVQTALIDTVMKTSSEERCLMVAEHMEKIIDVLLADARDED